MCCCRIIWKAWRGVYNMGEGRGGDGDRRGGCCKIKCCQILVRLKAWVCVCNMGAGREGEVDGRGKGVGHVSLWHSGGGWIINILYWLGQGLGEGNNTLIFMSKLCILHASFLAARNAISILEMSNCHWNSVLWEMWTDYF